MMPDEEIKKYPWTALRDYADIKDQIQYLQVDNFKMEPIIQNLLKLLLM